MKALLLDERPSSPVRVGLAPPSGRPPPCSCPVRLSPGPHVAPRSHGYRQITLRRRRAEAQMLASALIKRS
jgi:hypothetical protein